MKKKLIIIIILIFAYEIITNANDIAACVRYSYQIWINDLFPSLFPFFIISDLLINYGFVESISYILGPIFKRIFNINSNATFVFIMSMISGLPSNAKYARKLYIDNKISDKSASKILMFSHFANPLFIIGTTSSFLHSKYLSHIILISHYLGNIIIGILYRNYNVDIDDTTITKIDNKPLGTTIANAVINTIDTLLLILGTTTVFLIIATTIFNTFNMPNYVKAFISCILEMTQGLKYISLLNISSIYKSIIITATLSFGGLSVHMQVLSIINDTKIKYKPFFMARIVHSIISSIICYVILKLQII